MNKNATVSARFPEGSNHWGKLSRGQKVTVLRTYWYNGEGWAKIRTAANEVLHLPDVFLDGVYDNVG